MKQSSPIREIHIERIRLRGGSGKANGRIGGTERLRADVEAHLTRLMTEASTGSQPQELNSLPIRLQVKSSGTTAESMANSIHAAIRTKGGTV